MVPLWLLTLFHYLSLTAAVLVLGLLAWHLMRSSRRRSSPEECGVEPSNEIRAAL